MKRRHGTSSKVRRSKAPSRKAARAVRAAERKRNARGIAKTLQAMLTQPREKAALRRQAVLRAIVKTMRVSYAEAVSLYGKGMRAPEGLKGVRYKAIFKHPETLMGADMQRRYYLRWRTVGKRRTRVQMIHDRATGRFVKVKTYRRQKALALTDARYFVLEQMLGIDRAQARLIVREYFGGDLRQALIDVAYKTLVVSVKPSKRERAWDKRHGRKPRTRSFR